jgi:type IV pilus assembly protein PilB
MTMQERNHSLRKKKLGEILIDAGVITEEQLSNAERNHSLRKKKLGEILIDAGVITEEQLSNALTLQQGKNKRLGKVLVELGYVDGDQVVETLSQQLSLPMVDCNDYQPTKELLDLVTKETAEQKLVLPLER